MLHMHKDQDEVEGWGYRNLRPLQPYAAAVQEEESA